MKESVKWCTGIGALSIIINMAVESMGRRSVWGMLQYLGGHPMVFLLNTLIIALPFAFVMLTRRKYFVTAVVSLFWLLTGGVNGVLLNFRTTPFTASDLRLAKYGFNMLSTYMTWYQLVGLVAVLAVVAAVCVLIWRKAPVEQKKVSYGKAIPLTVCCMVFVLGCTALGMKTGLVSVHFGNIGQAFQDYGFPYCFSNSLFNTGISKPRTYDSETMAMMEEELEPKDLYESEENQRPNIIMLQLESFFDPLVYQGASLEQDPIAFFRSLSRNYPSGYLNVPSVGAGTANTEFECITGMNLDFFGPGEYPYKTVLQKTPCESMAFDMKDLGYTAQAIHNNEGTFYDRNKVFAQLGFDTFTPIEYMYDVERNPTGWCKDEILVDVITKALNTTPNQDFVYAISVQGHGAYPDFEYYCQQIHEMDHAVKELVSELAKRNEPTMLVMYGDHLPGFSWEAEDMKNGSLFQTPYVVWNNLGLKPVKQNVEAYQLAAYVLAMADIREGTMIRYHQNYLEDPGADEEAYLEGMEVLEYDMLYGEQEIYGGKSPYQATDLQMGLEPITVDQLVYQDGSLWVYGENFNEYSKVFLNGKEMDTAYRGPGLLLVEDVPEKKEKGGRIEVGQVGRDRVLLGDAVMKASGVTVPQH